MRKEQNDMEKIDYTAPSTVWILPWKTGLAAQPTAGHKVRFSEAINILLGLPHGEQERAEIEIHGRKVRIRADEARTISQRDDFPRERLT
jgi:hypothetical protein